MLQHSFWCWYFPFQRRVLFHSKCQSRYCETHRIHPSDNPNFCSDQFQHMLVQKSWKFGIRSFGIGCRIRWLRLEINKETKKLMCTSSSLVVTVTVFTPHTIWVTRIFVAIRIGHWQKVNVQIVHNGLVLFIIVDQFVDHESSGGAAQEKELR